MKYLTQQNGPAGLEWRSAAPFLLAATMLFLLSWTAVGQTPGKKNGIDSILGVKIGMKLADAHEKLERYGRTGGGDKDQEEEEAGERKEAWTLNESEFSSIALKANGQGKVVWVTGFVRPGREIEFAKLGDLSSASRASDSVAIWNVATPAGGYRIVAKGFDGKALVVYILSLSVPPIQ